MMGGDDVEEPRGGGAQDVKKLSDAEITERVESSSVTSQASLRWCAKERRVSVRFEWAPTEFYPRQSKGTDADLFPLSRE
jgi:hypothetical protein